MIKTLLQSLTIALCSLVLIWGGVAVQAAEKGNFNGVWVLDKGRSSNLPQVFLSVEEYLLIVKQADDKSLSVATEFQGRGQKISSGAETFPTDGTVVEKQDPRGFTQRRSFRYADDQRLSVTTEKRFNGAGDVAIPNSDESETWELSDGGKTLTITIAPKNEAEGKKQVRVFVKKLQEGA
jgi:hypothetical protein